MKHGLTGTILWSLLALCVGVVLFVVKYEVKDQETRLADLNAQIRRNQENIHVLRAEWSYLNDPARLRTLAEKHLGMRPISPTQVATLDTLPADGIPATGVIYAATSPAKMALPTAAEHSSPAAKTPPHTPEPKSKLAEAHKPQPQTPVPHTPPASGGRTVAVAKVPPPASAAPAAMGGAARAPAPATGRRSIVIQSPALAERDSGGAQ
jgi:cell division protein FtsL